MRRDDCPKEKKETLLNELFKFSKSHLETVSLIHFKLTYQIYKKLIFDSIDGFFT